MLYELFVQKTNKGEALVKKLERLMFWLERLVGVVSIFFIPRFARFSNVFFCFSDFIYLICFALRLEVNPLPTVTTNTKNSPWVHTHAHMYSTGKVPYYMSKCMYSEMCSPVRPRTRDYVISLWIWISDDLNFQILAWKTTFPNIYMCMCVYKSCRCIYIYLIKIVSC